MCGMAKEGDFLQSPPSTKRKVGGVLGGGGFVAPVVLLGWSAFRGSSFPRVLLTLC